MIATESSYEYSLIHLPPESPDWAGVLTQFVLYLVSTEGRGFASWSGERLTRATAKSEGIVALADGKLLGMVLVEVIDQTADITLPWTMPGAVGVARNLALVAVQMVRECYPRVCYIRAERQLLPGEADPSGLEGAGFTCHWRRRMQLELAGWWHDMLSTPGYKLVPWQMRLLDAAAEVVFRANDGTLDAQLYAPFFGSSPAQCRKGLLAILAGSYGPILPHATLCALYGKQLVGVNLVISNDIEMASVIEISVDPSHQGRGLGRAMMVRSLRELKHAHYQRVELAVTGNNTHAIRLYESLGFSTISEFPVCVWPD